ncbi:unnamed protein product [Callosobruchus maculatus]|uniref:WAP domain-containing protein n=1 Tax=Callosobruchus maculatus TaxID=64391 RepID=A0A653C9Z5_CALMS|nr:unnamed protein product [Callosobruchus maculatus]VEN44503.1 unnamed protein product [Callosobruchus maculatus]VEN44504.1 unnamed protein product [Callosobruchus maculatus]
MMKFCSLFLVALILVAISEVQGQGHQIKAAPKDSPNLIVLDGDRKQGGKPKPECTNKEPCVGWFYLCSKRNTCEFDLLAPLWRIFIT